MHDWVSGKIGDFITLQRGFDITQKEMTNGNIPVISSSGVTGYHNQSMVTGPGVVTGRKGTLGKVYYVDSDYWPHDTTLWVKDFKGNFPRFVYYFLQTLDFLGMDVGSSNPTLNRNHVHPLPVTWPPLPEQRAIAHILGSLDDKIELNRRMNATLEATARALFQSWFVDFDPIHAKARGEQPSGMDAATAALFPDHFEDSPLGPIPAGWQVGTLRDCCVRVENGGTPRRDQAEFWQNGTIPWLTSGEVRQSIIIEVENHITESGLKNSSAKLWPIGTTVIAMYGATAGQATLLAREVSTNQACCGLLPKNHFQNYLYLYTSSSTETLEGYARGSAQQNLSQKIIADFPVIIPPDDILAVFNTASSPAFELWIHHLKQSRILAETRDALLPKLISGEVRVETAEILIEETS